MYKLFSGDQWIPQHHDDRVSSQKHLGDVTIFIHWFGFLLSFPALRHLSPHLLYVLQDHVTVSRHTQTDWIKSRTHCKDHQVAVFDHSVRHANCLRASLIQKTDHLLGIIICAGTEQGRLIYRKKQCTIRPKV